MIKFLKGFSYAAAGVVHCLTERNFRVHICAVCLVSWFALKFYELSRSEWAVLLLTFSAVISAEAINTALERLCDKVSTEHSELIRRCKDCAAGAVLIAAFFAVLVGAVIFWDIDRLLAVWDYFISEPLRLTFPCMAAAVSAVFVFLPERFKDE